MKRTSRALVVGAFVATAAVGPVAAAAAAAPHAVNGGGGTITLATPWGALVLNLLPPNACPPDGPGQCTDAIPGVLQIVLL